MSPKARKALAIVALCFMPIFVVSLSLTLGFSDLLGGWMPAIAGISGGIAILLFLFLKMDENRTKRKNTAAAEAAIDEQLKEGAKKLEEDIAEGRAIDVTESDALVGREAPEDAPPPAPAATEERK